MVNLSFEILFLIVITLIILFLLIKNPQSGLVFLVIFPCIVQVGLRSFLKMNYITAAAMSLGAMVILYFSYQFLFFRQALTGKMKILLKEKNISFLMFLFLAWIFFCTAYGLLRGNEILYVGYDFCLVVVIPLVYFLTLIIIKNKGQCKKIFYWLIISVSFFFILDLFLYFLGETDIVTVAAKRIHRIVTYSASYYPIIMCPLIFSFYLFSGKKRKGLWFLLSFLAFSVLLLSFYRTSWYAVAGGLLFMFLFLSIQDKIKVFYKILPVLLIVFLLGTLIMIKLDIGINFRKAIMIRGLTFYSLTVESRLEETKTVGADMLQDPLAIIIGKGMGAKITRWQGERYQHFIHNNYARLFLHTGIIGLILYSVIALVFLKKSIRFFKKLNNDCFNKSLVLGAIGAFIAMLIGAISNNTFHVIFTYILMGMVMVIIYQEGKKFD